MSKSPDTVFEQSRAPVQKHALSGFSLGVANTLAGGTNLREVYTMLFEK
jgi:hypothetical protein